MNISIILAHPEPASLNHAIAMAARAQAEANGHHAIIHDLYVEGFDPILPANEIPKNGPLSPGVEQHCRELSDADGIIIIHPNWWGQPPAILKGWIDRVIRPGTAYEFVDGDGGEGVPVGLLRAHTVLVFNTSNTNAEREREVFGDPLQLLWKNCIFDLCGVDKFDRRMYCVVVTSTQEQRFEWLNDVRRLVDESFPSVAAN